MALAAALTFLSSPACAGIIAAWSCEGAGNCGAINADDIGNGVIKYSSSGDIPVESVYEDQLNEGDSFTFSFNQKDSPPFDGIEDTTKNEEIYGEILNGMIKVEKQENGEVMLSWQSLNPGGYGKDHPLPADWAKAAGGNIRDEVELTYDPSNNNYITSLDVTFFMTPEPSSFELTLIVIGLISLRHVFAGGGRER